MLGINEPPVTIKQIEKTIVDRAFEEGWIVPEPPAVRTGKRVAVIGSGPAGLAAAQQLARAGHDVTVFEKSDRIGGLLRYGIPNFKMEKHLIDRRMEQMAAEGVRVRDQCARGRQRRRSRICAASSTPSLLAGGAEQPRDLNVPGRELKGIHFAMEFLPQQNKRCEGDTVSESQILATGKRVVIIGGGDTGADCLGTSHRQKRALGPPVRDHAEAARRARRRPRRGRCGRCSCASRARTKRAASASGASPPRSSPATSTAT